MKKRHLDFELFLKESLKDPEIKAEYDRLEPEFAVINAIIEARNKKGMTQEKLAKKMKTTQSVLSRLESGNGNPSISFLQRIAEALGANLEIKFTPIK